MRTLLILSLLLVGCSDDKTNNTPPADAAVDAAPPVALTCANYCAAIKDACTGTNVQYPDDAHCMAACASFPMGAATDMGGQNTLGCRINHAALAKTDQATHCPHAGPGGDKTSVVNPPGTCGDACTSFCTLEIKACGTTTSAPTTGQYADMTTCITACKAFPNSDHAYGPTSKGDSLACRLYHATNAAITGNAMIHCPHTAAAPAGTGNPCLAGSAPSP